MVSAPSHNFTFINGKVVVEDLELFVGFDDRFDDPDGRMSRFDDDEIRRIVESTNSHMAAGDRPKLIDRHNPDDTEADGDRPVIGDILTIREREINGVLGIVGDVEMSREDFDTYLASNRYPRRSAEIWTDSGYMSEVALLGSETPARPLPNTKFKGRERFDFSAERFVTPSPDLTTPGSGNVFPVAPDDDDDDQKDTNMALDDATRKFIAQAVAAGIAEHFKAEGDTDDYQAEDDEEVMEEDEEKSKSSRRDAEEVVRLRRQNDRLQEQGKMHARQIAQLESAHREERFSRELTDMVEREGFRIADFEGTLQRVIAAEDPVKELQFIRDNFAQDPIDTRVDMSGARPRSGSGGGKAKHSQADHERAAAHARKKCLADGDSSKFTTYYDEALAG